MKIFKDQIIKIKFIIGFSLNHAIQTNSINMGNSSLIVENFTNRVEQLRTLITSFIFFNKRENIIEDDQSSSFFMDRIRKEIATDFHK